MNASKKQAELAPVFWLPPINPLASQLEWVGLGADISSVTQSIGQGTLTRSTFGGAERQEGEFPFHVRRQQQLSASSFQVQTEHLQMPRVHEQGMLQETKVVMDNCGSVSATANLGFQGTLQKAVPCEAVSQAGYLPHNVGRPRRQLTAYNIFFKHERARMLREGHDGEHRLAEAEESPVVPLGRTGARHRPKIGFAEMARRVSRVWKTLGETERDTYKNLAAQDKQRYLREKTLYMAMKKNMQD